LRYIGVLNRDGGTFKTMDMDAFCAQAKEVFAAHGHDLDCRVVAGKEMMAALEAAMTDPAADVVLAGGGDGTISTAADLAWRHQKPLAVLPAGTMNLFARALQVPLELDGALTALAAGEIKAVDIATANGQAFVHQFGVGIHARLVRIRDGLTYKSRIGKMAASLRAFGAALSNPPKFAVDIRTRTGVERRQASGVNVSNNLLGAGHLPHADRLDQGVLGLYVAKPMSSAAMARLFVDVMTGNWRHREDVIERELDEVTLQFPRRKRSTFAVIDGELIKLEDQVHIQLHPGALKVIQPHIAEDQAAA